MEQEKIYDKREIENAIKEVNSQREEGEEEREREREREREKKKGRRKI